MAHGHNGGHGYGLFSSGGHNAHHGGNGGGGGGHAHGHTQHAHHIGAGLLMAVLAFPKLSRFLTLFVLVWILK